MNYIFNLVCCRNNNFYPQTAWTEYFEVIKEGKKSLKELKGDGESLRSLEFGNEFIF